MNYPDVIKKDESRTIATSLTTNSLELHTMVWTSNMEESVLILGGQIHENKLNQTLTANKYRTTVTYRPPNVGYQRNEKENYEP